MRKSSRNFRNGSNAGTRKCANGPGVMGAKQRPDAARLGGAKALLGLAPVLLMLVIFFVGPLVVNVSQSLRQPDGAIGFGQYLRLLTDSYYLTVIGQTLLFGVVLTLVTAILGYPFGYAIARARGTVKSILIFAIVAPLLINVVVRSFGWMVILGGNGALNAGLAALGFSKLELIYNWTGVSIAMVHVLLPFMALSVASTLETLDLRLGRGRCRRSRRLPGRGHSGQSRSR